MPLTELPAADKKQHIVIDKFLPQGQSECIVSLGGHEGREWDIQNGYWSLYVALHEELQTAGVSKVQKAKLHKKFIRTSLVEIFT